NAFPLKPVVAPDRGIGPGVSVASDNTLGSFSPYQGRLYVAYTNWVKGNGNPVDNTDIYLATSDDGGQSWAITPKINDDDATIDGQSGAFDSIRGRPQFMPSVAVDQTTGTLVMTWYDARLDPARAQVSQFIATSIDGGTTFAPQTFVNTPNTVTDAITGKVITRGPIPDNQSNVIATREGTFSFGLHQGLTVIGGHVYPVWSGNINGGLHGKTLLDILTAGVTIAAGPRIISSTEGAVSLTGDTLNPAATDGSPAFKQFQVVFDRPIDSGSFTKDA